MTILVTGAAGAIGGAITRALAKAHPDAKLALVDRDRDGMRELANELGTRATLHALDLRDIAALPGLVDAIGPLTGLVNCAGIMRVQSIATWDWQAAQDLVAIDLLAPLRLMDLAVKSMTKGFIVNISSMAGKVPLKGCAYYGASKAGLAMASEIARADLAPRGITVVTVYPGPVTSPLEQGARDDYGGAGLFGKYAPTGDPGELADRVVDAIANDEARVVYPRAYGIGITAPSIAQWFALSYGPPPVR